MGISESFQEPCCRKGALFRVEELLLLLLMGGLGVYLYFAYLTFTHGSHNASRFVNALLSTLFLSMCMYGTSVVTEVSFFFFLLRLSFALSFGKHPLTFSVSLLSLLSSFCLLHADQVLFLTYKHLFCRSCCPCCVPTKMELLWVNEWMNACVKVFHVRGWLCLFSIRSLTHVLSLTLASTRYYQRFHHERERLLKHESEAQRYS